MAKCYRQHSWYAAKQFLWKRFFSSSSSNAASQSWVIVACSPLGCSCLNSQTCKYFPSCSGLPRTKMQGSLQKICACVCQPESPRQLGSALLSWIHPSGSARSSQLGLAGLGLAGLGSPRPFSSCCTAPAPRCARRLALPLPSRTQAVLSSVS